MYFYCKNNATFVTSSSFSFCLYDFLACSDFEWTPKKVFVGPVGGGGGGGKGLATKKI